MEKPYKPLAESEQLRLMKEGDFRDAIELGPEDKIIKKGDKLAVLNTYGETKYYTVTQKVCPHRHHIVGRKESGEHKGLEFCLRSSMSDCYMIGYKVIDNFPWEKTI